MDGDGVPVTEGIAADRDRDVRDQPPARRVRVEEVPGGLRLLVPPAGIWRGSRGLMLLAVVWCAILSALTAGLVVSGLREAGALAWYVWLFIAGFRAVGAALLLAAVNMGLGRALLTVAGDTLQIEVRGLFGKRRMQWHRGELAAVRMDASGMKVNDEPVPELRIEPTAGKKVGLMAGRDEQELRWVATLLRRQLALPARRRS